MRICAIEVENFRGIARLEWSPNRGITALVGPGDSAKTTILDALGLLFSPRWNHTFTDNDFNDVSGDSSEITIRATVAHPPAELLRMEAFANYTRGVDSSTGEIVDEPHDEDPALTVELRVDRYLEPRWQVVADRQPEAAPLRASHRAAFGVVRIGSDNVNDLRWSKNSALLRMTGTAGQTPTAQALVEASRAAKKATLEAFTELDSIATKVTHEARALRAVAATATLSAALNSDSLQVGEGSVSLHEGGIPMERHGLGSRRLTGIAVQLADSADARVLLVDEVEAGLEPYRIRHLLRSLHKRLETPGPLSQVFLTTHSPVVLRELTYSQLGVVRKSPEQTIIRTPTPTMQRMLRANAEAFLAPRVLVCEGATEAGFARGVYAHAERKDGSMMTAVATADAGGEKNLVDYAAAFNQLGYRVAIFCDYDTTLDLSSATLDRSGAQSHPTIVRCDKGKWTEQQVAESLGLVALRAAIQHGIEALGVESVTSTFNNHGCTSATLQGVLSGDEVCDHELQTARNALGQEAGKGKNTGKWFKSVSGGEDLAGMLLGDSNDYTSTPAGRLVSELEAWARA